jgi:WD40 repeat protein
MYPSLTDGWLLLTRSRLLDLFFSYYGGLICVCWSPDGKYVLTGGQDDLISIWCPSESALIARCQGHHSWITSVAFDPWRCDDKNYRFGSVGEDCRLCLWDFSVGMLHRPKAASLRQRASISSRLTLLQRGEAQNTLGGRLRSNSNLSDRPEEEKTFPHPVEPRSRTAMLPPILVRYLTSSLFHTRLLA